MLEYHWEKTEKINRLLSEIEVMRKVYEHIPLVPRLEEKLLRHSLLKSAVFSARIEGIPSTIQVPRVEAQNLVTAYKKIFTKGGTDNFTVETVKGLHGQAMRHLSAAGGQWRQEPWAVYNQAGIAIHIAPPHFKLPQMMEEYIEYINGLYDHPAEVAAAAQFVLEKIHPFADGNGRTGRLVSAYLLQKGGYGFRGMLMLEEYIEKHRENYYQGLEPSHDATGFVEFFLEGIGEQTKTALERFKDEDQEDSRINMLPRRGEILELITDHPRCTFDFLTRRFMSVNPKTLHYDLNWLLKKRMIKKLGVTRGVVYEAT